MDTVSVKATLTYRASRTLRASVLCCLPARRIIVMGGVAAAPIPPSLARGCPEEQMRYFLCRANAGQRLPWSCAQTEPCHAHDFTPHWALLHKTVPVDSCRMIHLRPFREVYFLSTLQLFPSVLPLPITSSLGIPLLFRVHAAPYQNSRKLSASTRNKLTKKDAFNWNSACFLLFSNSPLSPIPQFQSFIMASNGVAIQQEKVNTDIVTLTRFLTEEQAKHKEATGDFT